MARTPDFVTPQDPNSLSDKQRRTIQSQMQERLRGLLADRFGLVVRRETREQPIYALVVAKNGPKLQPTKQTGSNGGTTANMTNGRARRPLPQSPPASWRNSSQEGPAVPWWTRQASPAGTISSWSGRLT